MNIKEIIEMLINGLKYGYKYVVATANMFQQFMVIIQRHASRIATSTQNAYIMLGILSVFLVSAMRLLLKKGAN